MNHNKNKLTISIFLLLLVSIGIVYAYLTSNLTLSGTTKLAGNTWDIHFANLVVNSNSVNTSTPATIDPTDDTSIDYEVTLDKPGDFYEFTVDIVNAGSITGKISLITNTGIPTELEDIIDYSITYYKNNNQVQLNDLLNHNSSKNIKVRVYFKEDISNSDLPSDDIDLDLNLSITYTQSNEDEVTTDMIIQQLKTENSSCFTKYTGQVTDQVGETVTASNVYFNKCADKRNIIFNNMCWQMIRTTETGGIKLVYNGDVEDDKCLSTRDDHERIFGFDRTTETFDEEYLYGHSFTYDIATNEFTLIDTTPATWSDSTYENLIGKYTCKDIDDNTCTTLYEINGYETNTTAYTTLYNIAYTSYSEIGLSSFNANPYSPAMVGYMFNKVYNIKSKSPGTTEYKYGNTFTYNNGTYTLSGTTQNISNWSTGHNQIDNTHYTCWNTSGTCSTISYIYLTSYSTAYYIDITGGKSINDALEEMLSSNDVNKYNSSIKGIIDAWYRENLLSKTNMLEDTVYCNARNMTNQSTNGWNKDGSLSTSMFFKNYTSNNDLSCTNVTDQFAISNNKAKLAYPVGLATHEELYTLTNNNSSSFYDALTKTNSSWWTLSPHSFSSPFADVHCVDTDGVLEGSSAVFGSFGVRPVVTLSTGAVVTDGEGTESDPWIVE